LKPALSLINFDECDLALNVLAVKIHEFSHARERSLFPHTPNFATLPSLSQVSSSRVSRNAKPKTRWKLQQLKQTIPQLEP
jgi:hypothetical protein